LPHRPQGNFRAGVIAPSHSGAAATVLEHHLVVPSGFGFSTLLVDLLADCGIAGD
jgi:hypothetical protein